MTAFFGDEGQGCQGCTYGIPFTVIDSPAGKIVLCFGCTLRRMPDRDAEYLEAHHAPFADHIKRRMKAAAKKELAHAGQARMGRPNI